MIYRLARRIERLLAAASVTSHEIPGRSEGVSPIVPNGDIINC